MAKTIKIKYLNQNLTKNSVNFFYVFKHPHNNHFRHIILFHYLLKIIFNDFSLFIENYSYFSTSPKFHHLPNVSQHALMHVL